MKKSSDMSMLDRVARSAVPYIAYNLSPTEYEAEPFVESPIELMMLLGLEVAALVFWKSDSGICWLPPTRKEPYGDNYSYYVVPQYRLKTEAGNYRVDLMIVDGKTLGPRLAIECDGHDFHERTKIQAKKDKSRDRAIQLLGIPVYRFTGSEVYANAVGCAVEVLKHLDAR